MADDGMFAPLSGTARAPKRVAAKNPWRPIIPIPGDVSPVPARHPHHGKPSQCWTYSDAAGQVLGYVLRFDPADGKEFAPLTYCENAATGAREWRFKA